MVMPTQRLSSFPGGAVFDKSFVVDGLGQGTPQLTAGTLTSQQVDLPPPPPPPPPPGPSPAFIAQQKILARKQQKRFSLTTALIAIAIAFAIYLATRRR
jgi:hypothetical protein